MTAAQNADRSQATIQASKRPNNLVTWHSEAPSGLSQWVCSIARPAPIMLMFVLPATGSFVFNVMDRFPSVMERVAGFLELGEHGLFCEQQPGPSNLQD